MGLILDCYTALQRAETLIRSFLLMAETLMFAWNFCCRCRESSLIEIFGNLIHPAVFGFRQTENSTTASQSQRNFQAWRCFWSICYGNAKLHEWVSDPTLIQCQPVTFSRRCVIAWNFTTSRPIPFGALPSIE